MASDQDDNPRYMARHYGADRVESAQYEWNLALGFPSREAAAEFDDWCHMHDFHTRGIMYSAYLKEWYVKFRKKTPHG